MQNVLIKSRAQAQLTYIQILLLGFETAEGVVEGTFIVKII